MRTYLILKEKARRFAADPEIQAILADLASGNAEHAALFSGGYSPEAASKIKSIDFDVTRLAQRGLQYEKLDQLTVDLILGVR
jgi:xylose isomerase